MVVQHNISAMNANRYFGINNSGLSKSLEKLSSGYAINRAGDNAAGLAVSEKMRAQISGLTQASKNAEDGISMVQTFEGALTETDSILQRMRTLAVQSANGTYQDDVDREAIQLEFDQLNDELNQIADTDFNGVVALNGGQMADGLKATDKLGNIIGETSNTPVSGVFDYANKEQQVVDAARAEAQAAVDAAQEELTAAQDAKANAGNFDLSENGDAKEWNTVDNSMYNKTAADALWGALKLTSDGSTAAAKADVSKGKEVSVTFEMQTDGTWKAMSATIDGEDSGISASDLQTALVATNAQPTGTTATDTTGKGGFSVKTGTTTLANAVYNSTDAKAGDTVTLTFTNAANTQYAPTNIGFDQDTVDVESSGTGTIAAPTVALSGVKDADMNDDIQAAFEALEDVEFTAEYDGAATLDAVTLGGVDISTLMTTTGGAATINGTKVWIKADATAPTKITVSTVKTTGGVDAEGTELFEIGITAPTTNHTGSVSGTISISTSKNVDNSSAITVKPGDDANLGSAAAYDNAIAEAQAKLDEALAKQEAIVDYESAREAISGVSVSDSYDQSTATLTYQNNITLQTGARSKDSVNFTFKYASNGLGELKADMDCSARGLGTDQLSLASQQDANAAIDKIDNAINKVSMVRATFGAMQNRLEHKIANIDVNTENLTAAESRIRDTDMAQEMTNFTKNQILSQASQAMLAQANQLPQGVLQLLG